jgi:hypothetical protein
MKVVPEISGGAVAGTAPAPLVRENSPLAAVDGVSPRKSTQSQNGAVRKSVASQASKVAATTGKEKDVPNLPKVAEMEKDSFFDTPVPV